MHIRGTDAIPLAHRPSLEQYRKLAKDLVKALRTNDRGAVRMWAAAWIQRLRQLPRTNAKSRSTGEAAPALSSPDGIDQDIDSIVSDAERARLLHDGSESKHVSLAAAHLFIARLHGFRSWRQCRWH